MRSLIVMLLMLCAVPACAQMGPYTGPNRPPTALPKYPVGFQSIYPRTFMYSYLGSNGTPFRTNVTLWTGNIQLMAKWDNVIIDVVGNRAAAATSDNRPVVQMLRALNPGMRMSAYGGGAYQFKCATGWYWDSGHPGGGGFDWNNSGALDAGDSVFTGGCDTTAFDLGWARVRAIRQNNALLYSRSRDRNNDQRKDAFCNGSSAFGHCTANPEIDFAMPGVAQALADTIAAWAQELPGVYNGVFIDELCSSVAYQDFSNAGGSADSIDFTRSGNGSLSTWDTAYKAGVAAFINRLDADLPNTWIMTGNCGAVAASRTLNGWMRENFPDLNGGTWNSNMLGPAPGAANDVGYLGDDAAYLAPINTMLTKQKRTPEAQGNVFDVTLPQDALDAQRQHRWVLGSATLGEGMGTMVGTTQDALRGFLPWWADEFAVTPDGRSVLDPAMKGWLGAPLGGDYLVGSGYRRDFKGGSVIVNPTSGNVTFTFDPGFYRLLGRVCPTVNDGSAVTTVVLPAHDALFVQRRPQMQ